MEIKKPKQFIIYTPQQWFINILNELEITSDANYILFTNRYDGDTYVKYFKHSGIIVYSYGYMEQPSCKWQCKDEGMKDASGCR